MIYEIDGEGFFIADALSEEPGRTYTKVAPQSGFISPRFLGGEWTEAEPV